jgi:putative transport protein
VGVGNAISYPFGVLIVILAMKFLPNLCRIDVEEEKRRYAAELASARSGKAVREIPEGPFSILSFVLVCLVGYLLGNVEIRLGPLGFLGLSSTGGTLIAALILGYIGKLGPLRFRMEAKVLRVLRDYSLAFFLAVVGLKYGNKALDALVNQGISIALVSLAVGLFSILVAYLVGRYIFRLNWVLLSGAICGGMTSTPGLGAAVDALDSDDPAAGYGATYPFALLGMIIFCIIMYKLPIF